MRDQHKANEIKKTPNDQLFVLDTGAGQKQPTREAKRKALIASKVTRSAKKRKKVLTEPASTDGAVFNLWGAPKSEERGDNGFKMVESDSVRISATGRRTKRRDAKIVKNAPRIRKVSVPTAGHSYNPSKDAHEDAISEAAATEYARIERLEKEKMPEPTMAIAVDDYTDEEEEEGEDKDEDKAEDTQLCAAKKPLAHRSLKKSRQQRQRAQRQKLQVIESKKKKAKVQAQHEIFRSKTINKELDARRVAESDRRSMRHKLRQEALDQPLNRTVMVGGKKRLLEPCPEVALSEDLKGSLLKMKAQGNVLTDRWHSMLERNKFELGDKERIPKLKKDQRRAHKAYGKAHWGPAALIKEAEKRAN